MAEHEISRRSFIKAIVAGGVAVAGIGSLASCAEKDAGVSALPAAVPTAAPVETEAVPTVYPGRSGVNNGYSIGQVMLAKEHIVLNADRPTLKMTVTNTGDRPIQVCSHYHFFEVNNALQFDREETFGMRLDIPAGSAIRFEPGEQKNVNLTTFAGDKKLYGFQGWTQGAVDDPKVREAAMARMREALREG